VDFASLVAQHLAESFDDVIVVIDEEKVGHGGG
jgi:hypothetical protein